MIWILAKSISTALVGAAGELSTLALLHQLSVPLVVAFAAVQLVGMSITFTFNKLWVFGAAKSGAITREGMRASVVFAGSFLLNTAVPSLCTYGGQLSPFAAYVLSQVMVYACWSFPLNRLWVFPVRKLAITVSVASR